MNVLRVARMRKVGRKTKLKRSISRRRQRRKRRKRRSSRSRTTTGTTIHLPPIQLPNNGGYLLTRSLCENWGGPVGAWRRLVL